MTVRTYWAWETTATLRLLGGARRFGAHRGRRGAGAYRGGAYSLLLVLVINTQF